MSRRADVDNSRVVCVGDISFVNEGSKKLGVLLCHSKTDQLGRSPF